MPDIRHTGQCHCGAVKFKFLAPADVVVTRCNCSICAITGFEHIIVAEDKLAFVRGEDDLSEYRFGTGTARHLFCKNCGIKPLYRPRSHPEGWSVNYRCVIPGTLEPRETRDFDGQNWDASVAEFQKSV